jgi:ATP-dependent Clp protease ATP-binding subunit ClpB
MIMTSNLTLDMSIDPEKASEQEVRNALARELRPEFVNRIDEVIVFRRLGRRHLESLLGRLLGELNFRLKDRQFRVDIGPELREKLVAVGSNGQFGGRAVRRAFQSLVVDAVSDRVLAFPSMAEGAWTIDLDEDGGYRWREEFKAQHYLPAAK